MMLFKLTGSCVSKARPRFYNNRVMLPKKYRDWKDGAIHELYMQRINFDESVKTSEVHMIFLGKHNRKCDLDNQFAGVIDCLVDVGFLKNDNMSTITKISAELKHSTDSPYTLIQLS